MERSFQIWADFKYIVENSPTIHVEFVPNVLIFDNKNIMIGGKYIFKKTWFDKNFDIFYLSSIFYMDIWLII